MKKVVLLFFVFFLGSFAFAQQDSQEEVRYNQYGVQVDRQTLETEAQNNILVFQSKDKKYKFWFDNRVQVDFGTFFGVNPDYDKIGNGATIRRARIAVKGQITEDWYGEVDTDFGDGIFELKDAYIEYSGLKNFAFKAGNFKEDFSMEATTTSRYLSFMERPMVVATFGPSRHIGIQAEYLLKHFRASAGVFFQAIEDAEVATIVQDNNKDYGLNQGMSYTGKVNYMPFNESRTMGLNIGVAGSYRQPKTDLELGMGDAVRYSTRNITSINRKKYLDTDVIKDVDHDILYGVELAGYYKGLRFQGEYIGNNTYAKENTYYFNGWYAQAGYLLFGGQHRFNTSEGEFTQPSRGKSWGDVEVLARYDYLNLNSGDLFGGAGNNYTLGITYYVNNSVKFMVNYAYCDNDRYANGKNKLFVGHDADGNPTKDPGQVTEKAGKGGVNYNMLTFRVEIDF